MTGIPSRDSVTGLLQAVEQGDRDALNELFPLIYDELSVLAHRQRQAWRGNVTLDTTAVVHEAYLKLADQTRIPAGSRAHFFGVAAKAMRHILCNYARDRGRQKRGGGVQHVTFEPDCNVPVQADFSSEQADTLMALDEALRSLERFAARPSRVVECRFFGGMSVEETATALGIAPRTVKRDWNFARAWLRREMQLTLGTSD